MLPPKDTPGTHDTIIHIIHFKVATVPGVTVATGLEVWIRDGAFPLLATVSGAKTSPKIINAIRRRRR